MSITLTEQQRRAVIAGQAVYLTAPEIGQDVVLLNAGAYRHLQEIAEDDLQQAAFRSFAGKQAANLARDNPY